MILLILFLIYLRIIEKKNEKIHNYVNVIMHTKEDESKRVITITKK